MSFVPTWAHFLLYLCHFTCASKAAKCRIMFTKSFVLHAAAGAFHSPLARRKSKVITNGQKANLIAKRKERIRLPRYSYELGNDFRISKFFAHPSGVESLLNTRALQRFELIASNTYRCTLPKVQLLNSAVVPEVDLKVVSTSEDCTVEMLSCKFAGTEVHKPKNEVYSASMVNHITWKDNGLEPCLEVEVTLKITLEIITAPFSLLPISVVEKPGNMVMQGLIDTLVPLLGKQILEDYCTWMEKCLLNSQHPHIYE